MRVLYQVTVFTMLAVYIRYADSQCKYPTINCNESGGEKRGTPCVFEPDEELAEGTVIAELVVDLQGCLESDLVIAARGEDQPVTFLRLEGLNITMNQVVDYDEDVEITRKESLELRCTLVCKIIGSPNLFISFNNLNDNDLTLEVNKTEAEVTELLTYTESVEEEPQIVPSPPIFASDFDRQTEILYKIMDEGVPFKLINDENDIYSKIACFNSKTDEGDEINYSTPSLVTDGNFTFNRRRQPVYNMTIGIYSFHADNTGQCNLGNTEEADESLTLPLVVTVRDLDDQPPTFKDTFYQANVDENSDDITVSPVIEAYDLDTGIDAKILYSMQERGDWDCTSYVTVDSLTGVVSIRDGQLFDYEDRSVCELDLKAEQENDDLKIAYAPLTITVKDVNDICPEVNASASEGLFVDGDDFVSDEDLRDWLYLRVTDEDTEVSYAIEISSQYFQLEGCLNDDNCYWIKPDNTIAETETVVITVTDTLFDGSYCNNSLAINISVPHESTILDPTFDGSDYRETIDENYAGFIIQVTATSSDGTKDGIRYSLDQNNIYFSIDEFSGNILLIQGLDYETMPHSYELTVTATDIRWTDAERSADAIVTITLSNLNDNAPVLEGFPFTLYVAESTPNGTTVAYIQASDADEDATLFVKFDTIPPEFPFEMDQSGAISVNGILDADVEAQREYNATVVVNDGVMSSSPENLTVVVLDVNDNAPNVSAESNFKLEMTENTIGPISFQIEVTDLDYLQENRKCSVTSSGEDNVEVTSENTVVEVVGPFDREAQEKFQFSLFVENTAPPYFQITQPVEVTILDVNDNSPVFTQETMVGCSSLSISEGPVELSENPLCTFEATDADEPGSANAKITYLVEENGYFEMDNETGQLLLVNPLDRESQENMTIRVSAADNGNESLSVSMTVLIEVTGINDNRPTFDSATYEELVHEETAINTLISTLTAMDFDVPSQDPIYYKAVNEQDPVWNTFYLKSEDGLCKIYLLQALDYSQSPYRLEIATYDGDKNPYYDSTVGDNTTTLVVNVQQRATCNISAADGITETINDVDLVDNGIVADVDASSSCGGAEDDIMFTLDEEVYVDGTGVEMITNYFSVNSATGEIYAEDVTNIDVGTYRLTVTATNDTGSDLDQTSDTAEVVIIVSDTNNNCPYFEKIFYSSRYMMGDEFLSQDGAPDWLVITAIDGDSTFIGDIEFPMNASFEEEPVMDTMERRTFQVRVMSELSQNTNLTVTVTDGNCSDSSDIFVMVVMSLAPTFENDTYIASVLENSEAGESVIKVSAINSAGNSQNISYNIVSPLNSPFGIDTLTGEIFVAYEGIDYEAEASYLLNVSATDERWTVESDRTSYAEVAVTVLDQNEFAPLFLGLPADVSIQESIPSGSEVFILRAFDNDVDDNKDSLKYELVDGADGKFIVDPDSGTVLTNYLFDFETDAVLSYLLQVQVTDGVYETVGTLTVNVMDVNDNPPVFNDDSLQGNFPENEDGPFLINASASDVDSQMLSYSLSGGYPSNTNINEVGILTIEGNLDREEKETYNFSVVARDGTFQSTVEVTVMVEDKNDNTPEFTDFCNGKVSVLENSPVGTPVCQVSAVDADKEDTPFSQISYSLANNGDDYFQINSSTGEITVREEGLDFDTVKTHSVEVEATDINGSGRSSYSTIQIELEDLNDNPPVFLEHPDPIDIIFDHEIGDAVFTFLVTDLDEQPFNSFLCKELDASDAAWDTFYLTTTIGGCNLVLKATLNSSLTYHVRIEAYDINDVALTDSTEVDVVVLQRYPCELMLSVDDVEYYKTEVVQGQIVADVEATSNCSDSEEDVTFDIMSQEYLTLFNITWNPSSEFAIHSNNGTIYYNQPEGTPSVGVHTLVIRAQNNTNPSNQKSIELVITILDEDVEDPTFPEPPVDIPDNPDPDSLPVFIGRFDGDKDDYVYTFTGTDRLVIVVLDDDACFNGDVSIVDPLTPFSLEPLTDEDECNDNYQAYLKIENMVPPEEDLFTFEMEVTNGNYSEYANITVVQSSLDPSIESIQGGTVDENAPVGTSVVNVTAVNCDGTSDGIMYEITEQNVPKYFSISGGAVTVDSLGIDYESQTSYSLKISVIDTRWDRPRETSSPIEISVNDINEFAPEFASFTEVQLSESVATEDALVYRLQAFDGDGSSMLMFQLGNLSDTFKLDNMTGDLTLIRGLDAETDALSYFVYVIVFDGENIDEDVLTVQLIDVNEFPPNITGQSQVEMYENETETTLQIYSYDPDVSRLPIKYTMMPQDGFGSIDPSTGLITFVGPLNYSKNPYDYVVTATEIDGLFSSTFEVTLMVLNINDQPPFLDVSPCAGAEAQEGPDGIGAVCQVQAVDEEGSNFIFYLQDGSGKFDIDPSTGVLTVKNMLDREIQDMYELQLVVNDGGSPPRNSSVELVAVSVSDINDKPPVFAVHANPVYVEEGSDAGTPVIGLTTSDEDEFPYDISRCEKKDPEETLWQNFTILNVRSGFCEIITLAPLYTPSIYTLNIVVVDSEDEALRSETSVTVLVVGDITCLLSLSVDSPLTFDEDQIGPGDTVTTVSSNSTCSDSGDIAYEITEQSLEDSQGFTEDVDVFQIDEQTGEISVNSSSAVVRVGVYTLRVTAYNTSYAISRATSELVITINDINNNCPFFVTTLEQGLYAENDMFVYSLDSPNRLLIMAEDLDSDFTGNFSTNSAEFDPINVSTISTNLVAVQLSVNEGVTGNYTIQVEVTDNFLSNCSDNVTVDIFQVQQEDLAPTFSQQSFNGTVLENAEKGTFILTVTAEAFDGNSDEIVYSFDVSDDRLEIDETSGEITAGPRGIDFETTPKFEKLVFAEDRRWNPYRRSQVRVFITVEDEDEYDLELAVIPPLSVSENAPENTLIYTAWATDGDASSEFLFSLEGGNGTFDIRPDSGEIYVVGELDAEDVSEYEVIIIVTEESLSVSDNQTVTIGIQDMNDCGPEFNQTGYEIEIEEEMQGIHVLKVYASDKDITELNNVVTYSIDDDLNGRCSIDPKEGILTINTETNEFDRETGSEYTIVVTAEDSGIPTLSSMAVINVTILDINDNSPEFVDVIDPVVFEEESVTNTAEFRAEDLDVGINGEILYTVLSGDGKTTDLFSINENGLLTASVPLNREVTPSYNLIIYATDSGWPSRNASVNVLVLLEDIDDSIPVFQPPFQVVIEANTPPGSKVIDVTATDDDVFPNNIISYSPANLEDEGWDTFALQSIEDQTSIVLVASLEDAAMTVILEVQARNPLDSDGQRNTANQEYIIVVTDGTLCYVELEPTSYSAHETTNLTQGEYIVKINGTSNCEDISFEYQISSQILTFFNGSDATVTEDWFIVSSTDGVLSVNSNDLHPGTYQITVVAVNASDDTEKLNFVDSLVSVKITEGDNAPPFFINGGETITIERPIEKGGEVFTLYASDPDSVNSGNNLLSFQELYEESDGGLTDYFMVDADGQVTATVNLWEVPEMIVNLTVMVEDSGLPPLADFTFLLIELTPPSYVDPPPTITHDCDPIEYVPEGSTDTICTVTSSDEVVTISVSPKDFVVGEEDGTISPAANGLNFEHQQVCNVVVNVTSSTTMLSSSLQFVVMVTDVNEFRPKFENPYSFTLSEDSYAANMTADCGSPYEFGVVMATDEDGSYNNSYIEYSLDGDERFSVDPVSGILSKKGCIDVDGTPSDRSITLTVTASNVNADHKLYSNQSILVNVTDANDNPPRINVVGEEKVIWNEYVSNQEIFKFNYEDGDIDPVNQDSSYMQECSDERCESFLEFSTTGTTRTITTNENQPESSIEVVIIVTVRNIQAPYLEASTTVTFVYTNENVYFPDDIEFQSVTIEEGSTTGSIIAPVGGTTETPYSVRDDKGACSQVFEAKQVSETRLNIIAKQKLDYENVSEYQITIEVGDSCPVTTGRRVRRQTVNQVNSAVTTVTITVGNRDDIQPQFTKFTFPDSRNYYRGLHFTSIADEMVYDLSFASGRVIDEDGRPEDHEYSSAYDSELVEVNEMGEVFLREYLSPANVTGETIDLDVTVSDAAGNDQATLRLRVLSDADIVVVEFNPVTDPQGEKLLRCAQEAVENEGKGTVLQEREVRSEQSSALWLYGVSSVPEDFMDSETFQGFKADFYQCETAKTVTEEEVIGKDISGILVIILALLILIASILMILYLLCSAKSYKQIREVETPPETEIKQSSPIPTPSESLRSYHSPEIPVKTLSVFERIASQKNTSMYGSQTAILDLQSEGDALSVQSLSISLPPPGTDEKDDVDPYSVFLHNPKSKISKEDTGKDLSLGIDNQAYTPAGSKKSQSERPNENPEEHSNEDTLKDLLAEYDNPTYQENGPASPVKLLDDHTKEETSTDDILAEGERAENTTGSSGGITEGSEVGSNGVKGTTSEEKTPKKSEKDPTIDKEDGEEINMSGGMTGTQSFEKDPKVTSL